MNFTFSGGFNFPCSMWVLKGSITVNFEGMGMGSTEVLESSLTIVNGLMTPPYKTYYNCMKSHLVATLRTNSFGSPKSQVA